MPRTATTAGPLTASPLSAPRITQLFDNYYIASYRTYISYDQYLQTGPYNFGWANSRPDWVEHFPYQDGLLLSYWDTSFGDNNESSHPGQGLILPIDSHPQPIYRLDGQPWRGRIQTYDAPFSLQQADSFTLHLNGQASYIRGQDGAAGVRRQPVVLEPGAADRRSQGARRRSTYQRALAVRQHDADPRGQPPLTSERSPSPRNLAAAATVPAVSEHVPRAGGSRPCVAGPC